MENSQIIQKNKIMNSTRKFVQNSNNCARILFIPRLRNNKIFLLIKQGCTSLLNMFLHLNPIALHINWNRLSGRLILLVVHKITINDLWQKCKRKRAPNQDPSQGNGENPNPIWLRRNLRGGQSVEPQVIVSYDFCIAFFRKYHKIH